VIERLEEQEINLTALREVEKNCFEFLIVDP
jgi:hypothetical protein